MDSIAKLKWRCHRGTKELDFLLESYLDKHYSLASNEDQLLFEGLLTLQDSQLILLLLGEQLPDSEGLVRLVKKIRKYSNI